MPRALWVGNGNLQVNIDNDMNIRDMFFPFVGLENHVSGHFCRFGVWMDGRFSWIDDSWNKRFGYKKDSLVTEVFLKKSDLQLELQVEDTIHHFHACMRYLLRQSYKNNVYSAPCMPAPYGRVGLLVSMRTFSDQFCYFVFSET